VDDVRAVDVDGRLAGEGVGLVEDAVAEDLVRDDVRDDVLAAAVDLAQPGVDGPSALEEPG